MGNANSDSVQYSTVDQSSSNTIAPLYEACRDGNEELVLSLLPKYSHADLNRQEVEVSYNGNTCLHIAAANGHDNIVRILLQHGCYRSLVLNSQNRSAYDLAAANKESTRLIFLRHDEIDSPSNGTSRFFEQNASDCFDVIKLDEYESDTKDIAKPKTPVRTSTIQTFKTEKEKQHEIEYSASSKAMCQSRIGRFCVNLFHSDDPLDHHIITKRLKNLVEQHNLNKNDDYIKVDDLIKTYEKHSDSIEHLIHLYTLETCFYRMLKQDCLPLAIPLFIHLPKLKERYFRGRVYRGMHMTYDQFAIHNEAMETPGTLLQTRSFSSTSVNRTIAEEFAYTKKKSNSTNMSVLFIFDFPAVCDQAIYLGRISDDKPCLSEYENEQEVLVLPWTLFEVKRIKRAADDDDLSTIYLSNVIIPKKNLVTTFTWSFAELKRRLIKEKAIKFDCAFQKYKLSATKH